MDSFPTDTLQGVREFMETAGQDVPDVPTQPSPETLKLRLSLELEELFEKAEAMGLQGTFCRLFLDKYTKSESGTDCNDNAYSRTTFKRDTNVYDPVALLDAAIDQRYVQDGTVLACGLQDKFYPGFANVQESNMSKFCHSEEQVRASIEKYKAEGVEIWIATPFFPEMYPAIIKRKSDGKILKNAFYTPASLEGLFN